MALTITEVSHRWVGNQRRVTVDIDFDNSYPTGGESLSAADVGLGSIEDVSFEGNTGGYVPVWDNANEKVMMFEAAADGNPLDEVSDTTDLSAETVRATIYGRS